jgi:UDP-N-acetylglucosamine--N-acetylmuramyl-(pentapeptide) pyrophosphoryl-undecaprenol N-acetylglucosamine transferase
VFVPYPHHPDRQQFANAEPLVTAGGGKLIEEADLTPERVRRDVLDLLEDRASLAAMRAALDARPGAGAAETADDLIRFLGWKDASAAGSGRPRD